MGMKFVKEKKQSIARAEKALRLKQAYVFRLQVYNYAAVNLSLEKLPNISNKFYVIF